MRRLVMLAVVLSCTTSSNSWAAGALRRPEPHAVVAAGFGPSVPGIAVPDLTANDLIGGCGRGRIRDAQTHVCHGPADIR